MAIRSTSDFPDRSMEEQKWRPRGDPRLKELAMTYSVSINPGGPVESVIADAEKIHGFLAGLTRQEPTSKP